MEKIDKRLNLRYILNVHNMGKPEAVLMSYEEYESWLETLDIINDPELVKSINAAKEDIKHGKVHTYEEVIRPSSFFPRLSCQFSIRRVFAVLNLITILAGNHAA